jgi:hypothetical protein
VVTGASLTSRAYPVAAVANSTRRTAMPAGTDSEVCLTSVTVLSAGALDTADRGEAAVPPRLVAQAPSTAATANAPRTFINFATSSSHASRVKPANRHRYQ